MKIPPDVTVYQLRVKSGRRHMLVAQFSIPDSIPDWHWRPSPVIIGECRWYTRRRGQRWKPMGGWFRYVPA